MQKLEVDNEDALAGNEEIASNSREFIESIKQFKSFSDVQVFFQSVAQALRNPLDQMLEQETITEQQLSDLSCDQKEALKSLEHHRS